MEAKTLRDNLIEHLSTAGLQLRKWSSSIISHVYRVPESHRVTAETNTEKLANTSSKQSALFTN